MKRVIRYGGAVTGIEEERAIIRSIRKSRVTKNWQADEEAVAFEKELAKTIGVKYAILTNSGSSAGLLALSALELPKHSEVIIPAVTFPTIFNIIPQCNLTPVVVDCELGTYNASVETISKAITPRTRAIIAVHALGNPVDMPSLMKKVRAINKKRPKNEKIYVIEDNCDGLGTSIASKYAGSFGDVSITSLHAAHIVSTGVGGCVFTSSKAIAHNARIYRDWGRKATTTKASCYPSIPKDYNPRFIYEKVGYNLQILELQAAMGRVQLRKLKKIKAARKRNFNYLYKHLAKYPGLIMPKWKANADICWFAFPLASVNRPSLVPFLEKKGIETRSMFAGNILKHPAYKHVHAINKVGHFGEADTILMYGFWISCHPSLTKKDLEYIVKVFDAYYAQTSYCNTHRA